jgi:hypothetical protein
LPATCYLAPWQWPVTAARPLLSRSRAAKLRAWGRVRKPHNSITARPWRPSLPTKTMLHFHRRRRPRAPLDARTPSPGYIGPCPNPFGIALSASGPNGPPNRAVGNDRGGCLPLEISSFDKSYLSKPIEETAIVRQLSVFREIRDRAYRIHDGQSVHLRLLLRLHPFRLGGKKQTNQKISTSHSITSSHTR